MISGNRLLRALVIWVSMACSGAAYGQAVSSDPRQVALDVYSGINREMPPASIALKLRELIEIFRYRCNRVTDYQIFSLRPNITDLKVKCSGDPLYGITVASNGYVSVYGGNGILSGLDRRDAIIYSFASGGELAFDSSLTMGDALDETFTRIDLGDEYNYLYIFGMFMLILAVVIMGTVVWVRAWRRKAGRKPRQRIKPLQKHTIKTASSVKDLMFEESTEVAKYIRKHPCGLFIAVGKRGKRRLFASMIWAKAYALFSIKMFEASPPKELTDSIDMGDDTDESLA